MLSLDDRNLIRDICSRENSDDFVSVLISEYASSIARCSRLVDEIPKVTNKQLSIINQEINDIYTGLNFAICGISSYNGFKNTTKSAVQLIWILNAKLRYLQDFNRLTLGDKELLKQLVELMQNKKSDFYYKNHDSWDWAKQYNLDEFILKVVNTYVDKHFDPESL